MWEWHFIFKSRLRRNDCARFFQVLTLSCFLRFVTCTTLYCRFLDLPSSDKLPKFWKWTTYIPAVCDVTSAEDRQRHTVYMKLLLAFVASSRNNELLLSMRQVARPVGSLGLPIPACWHTGTRRPAAWPSVRTQQKSTVWGTDSSAVCVWVCVCVCSTNYCGFELCMGLLHWNCSHVEIRTSLIMGPDSLYVLLHRTFKLIVRLLVHIESSVSLPVLLILVF